MMPDLETRIAAKRLQDLEAKVYQCRLSATGRLSSSNPSLQNIPIRTELGKQIRQAFVERKGTTEEIREEVSTFDQE
jgi:DNA polymerase I-like protein with 3'-5' exonuclease and polymerase domains